MSESDLSMPHKVTLMYVDDPVPYDEDTALQGIETWLEKWDGQYKIIKDHGSHNEIMIEMDILCTKEAFEDLSDGFTCSTEWSRNEITEDEVLYGKGDRNKHRQKQIRNEKRSEGTK
jgi:hypothetical protein